MCKHLMVDSLLLTLRKPRFSFAQADEDSQREMLFSCLSQNEAIQNQSNATLLQAQLSTDLS